MKRLVVTGGLGFIGSHFVRSCVVRGYEVCVLDVNSYAADKKRLDDVAGCFNLRIGDIQDPDLLLEMQSEFNPDGWVHFAAESHVDRSIISADEFVKTNVFGTLCILQLIRSLPEGKRPFMLHMSTDEVFGSLNKNDPVFTKDSRYDPRSPYSASKASSDHFVRAFRETYNLNSTVINCSNVYGPWQHPEKLIPKVISNAIAGREIPVYGTGLNVRDWIHVEDVCSALLRIVERKQFSLDFLLGGLSEINNLNLIQMVCKKVDSALGLELGSSNSLVRFVEDRKGHDFRYGVDPKEAKKTLEWSCRWNLESGLEHLVNWSIQNREWLESKIEGI